MFTRDTMLDHHLQYNHYPPLPVGLVPFAARAIELAQDECWDFPVTIDLDEGGESTLLQGDHEVTVAELVADLHLYGFLEDQ